MDGSVHSPNGGIQAKTTERGLPIALKLDEHELSRPPMELAAEILSLCQLSGRRLQVARRNALEARGTSAEVIRGLQLSTAQDLQRAESELQGDDEDTDPDTWMRPT